MRKYHRGPTVSNHWYSIHYMLEWFQEQQKTVHCYNAKDKKGNSACRADFPSQQSEHFRLRFPCPDELVTREVKPWPRTPFSEKTHCSLVNHRLLSHSSGLAHTNYFEGTGTACQSIFILFPWFFILRASIRGPLSLNGITNSYTILTKLLHYLDKEIDAHGFKFKEASNSKR